MRIRLAQTTTFRLTVVASLAFVLVGAAVLAFLYFNMLAVFDRQIDGALQREYSDLTAVFESGGFDQLKRTVFDRASPHYDSLRIYLLIGPDGTYWGNLGRWPAAAPAPGVVKDIAIDHAVGAARVRTIVFADGSRVLIGRALTELNNFRQIVEESLLSVLFATVLLGIAASVILARYSRLRLETINRTAEEVLAGNLAGRVEVSDGDDEYDHLARNINAMLDRIERLIGTIRGVTENIAHDLRTPLYRLRGRFEVALMSPHSEEEYRGVLEQGIAETDTIVETFNALLKIARIKGGALDLERGAVDLREIVAELVDLYEAFADEKGVHIEMAVPPTNAALTVTGDGHLISQAVANLLDNAVKYSPAGGTVVIGARREGDTVCLAVADNGPGIPADKRAVVLDRFVRLKGAHDKQGFGLGLSFAAAVAEWHEARLDLADNHPGLLVTLSFAVAATD